LSDECIHGFEDGLCAICFPKPAPEVPAKPAAVRRAPASRTSGRATPSRTAGASRGKPIQVGTQRLYHVTHIKNLPAILSDGALLADAGAQSAHPSVDVSSAAGRETRRSVDVAGRPVAGFVPFFLSPHARVWDSLRSREPDPRLAGDAGHYAPAEFVILVTGAAAALATGESAVADRDAALPLTRFGTGRDGSERMLHSLLADAEGEALLDAEFLVADAFPISSVALIGVSDEKVRDVVKRHLAEAGTNTKVAVYPPWFRKADEPLA
jgi:hypothetical protein